MQIQKIFLVTIVFVFLFALTPVDLQAQCSICTRTAQQLGEKPARGLNAGILYLAFTPLILLGVIGYKFYKKNSSND
jgi:hypothetical protein